MDQLFVNLSIENTKTSLSLCCYFTEVDAVQGNQCFATKAVQYADHVTKEHVVITNGWHTIPRKPSLRWFHNDRLSILPVSVRCSLSCLTGGRGGGGGGGGQYRFTVLLHQQLLPLASPLSTTETDQVQLLVRSFTGLSFFPSSDLRIAHNENDHCRHAYKLALINTLGK